MASVTDAVHVTGHCYCGGITYRVDIPAGPALVKSGYCHCDSCRRAHAAPLYHVAIIDASALEITAGAELLRPFTKPGGHITRSFCCACGTRVLNRFDRWRPQGREAVAFFPSTLDAAIQSALPPRLRPRFNSYAAECVLDSEALAEVLGTE